MDKENSLKIILVAEDKRIKHAGLMKKQVQ
jgi:hypothetical protein